jgi:hypothetical protein
VHRWYIKRDEQPAADVAKAVEFEFNLPLGEGKTIDRAGVILDALKIS